jgi:hypothetical protein
METQQLLKAALEQGLLALAVPLCKDGRLAIYRLDPFSGKHRLSSTVDELYLRLNNGKLQLVSAGDLTHAQHSLSSYLELRQGQIVEHTEVGWCSPWCLSIESMANWCYWLDASRRHLVTKQRACRVPVHGQLVYLCKLTVPDMCALVDGAHWRHWQWTRRLLYLYLALDCNAAIVEAILHSLPNERNLFYVVEYLLSCNFYWAKRLTRMKRRNGCRAKFKKSSVVFAVRDWAGKRQIGMSDLTVIKHFVQYRRTQALNQRLATAGCVVYLYSGSSAPCTAARQTGHCMGRSTAHSRQRQWWRQGSSSTACGRCWQPTQAPGGSAISG